MLRNVHLIPQSNNIIRIGSSPLYIFVIVNRLPIILLLIGHFTVVSQSRYFHSNGMRNRKKKKKTTKEEKRRRLAQTLYVHCVTHTKYVKKNVPNRWKIG